MGRCMGCEEGMAVGGGTRVRPPLQGSGLLGSAFSQGVALGCDRAHLWC